MAEIRSIKDWFNYMDSLVTTNLSSLVDYKLNKLKQTNMNKRQVKVLQVATDFCKNNNNKISTKELKIELRNKYPFEQWNQYDSGNGVSDMFHSLVRQGEFVSVADNGTYQTYACTKLPLPKDRKGAAFIPDMEEGVYGLGHMANIHNVSAAAGLNTALSTASAKAKRGRPKTNTMPNKRATTVAKNPVGRPRKNPIVATAPTKRPVGRPRKVTIPSANTGLASTQNASTTSTVQPKPVTHNVKANKITRIAALDLMKNSKGRFFTATFIKKDNTERVINAKYLPDQESSELGYVKVIDQKLFKKTPNDCTRNINLQTLKSLKVGGTLYKIK